jgi:hypothetical protein
MSYYYMKIPELARYWEGVKNAAYCPLIQIYANITHKYLKFTANARRNFSLPTKELPKKAEQESGKSGYSLKIR